jgi:hypothetical protein
MKIQYLIPILFCVAGLLLGPEARRLELAILVAAFFICNSIERKQP